MNTIITEKIDRQEESLETQDMVEALAITLDEGISPQDDQPVVEPDSEPSQDKDEKGTDEPALPPGVTPEPQDPEHMDLRRLRSTAMGARLYQGIRR